MRAGMFSPEQVSLRGPRTVPSRTSITSMVALCAALSASPAASGATLIHLVPVQGSTATTAFGINNDNVIAGGWLDASGVVHGFFGTLAGVYTLFDYTSADTLGTEARDINDNDLITGYAPTNGNGQFKRGAQFEYDATTGQFETIERSGIPLDGIAQGINDKGVFVGNYARGKRSYGYLGGNGQWIRNLPIHVYPVEARGVNKSGVVVGSMSIHGFIFASGALTQVDYPDSTQTGLEGINDDGLIAGYWVDTSGHFHAFKFDSTTSTFTQIKTKGSTDQLAFGINNAGLIAVTGNTESYIYCPGKPTECPGNGVEVPDEPGIIQRSGKAVHAVAAFSH